MKHFFLAILRLGFLLIPHSFGLFRQRRSTAGNLTPTLNERLPRRSTGEPHAKLNTKHQGAMTITIVANPQLGTGGLIQAVVGILATNLAKYSGVGEFLADIGHFTIVH